MSLQDKYKMCGSFDTILDNNKILKD